MSTKQTDIIVSGAGIAGLALSILLARVGLQVALIDPADKKVLSNDAPSGRSVALMNSSLNVLKAAGVWPSLKQISGQLQTMRLMDISHGDPITEPFEAHDIGEEQFGYNVPNNALRAALYQVANQEDKITFYLERRFEGYVAGDGGVSVRLDDKNEIQSKLLIGADGRSSVVRKCAGIEASTHRYQQSALTFLINHSKSHENISTEFHRPEGPLALVPLPGNQCSVVWVNSHERCEELLRLKKQELEDVLAHETHDVLGGLTLESSVESWPLCSIKAKSLTAPRVALVAEAAHVMSPITAQGLNLSLRDIAALSEVIVDAARVGQDIGARTVLRSYEKRRNFDIDTRYYGVDGFMRLVSNDIAAIKDFRRTGLKGLSHLPSFKNIAMRVGLAPSFDSGRLVQGEGL